MSAFGERLDSKRNGTQKEFAKFLGVPLNSYTNWVRGIREPSMSAIVQLCTRLDVSADWLLGLPERGVGVTASGAASVAVGVGNAGPVTVNGTVNGPGRDCSACPLMAAHLETVRQLAAFQSSTPKRKGK